MRREDNVEVGSIGHFEVFKPEYTRAIRKLIDGDLATPLVEAILVP